MATILITGCKRGIGLDAAIRLDQLGYKVIASVRNDVAYRELKENLKAIPTNIICDIIDITKDEDRKYAATYDIDVLIHNAALGDSGPLAEIDLARIQDTIDVNILSMLKLTQYFIPRMARKGGCRIIFISSMAALMPTPFMAPYGLTKAAIENIAFSLKGELKPLGIQVTIVNPGAYETGFNKKNIDKKYEWINSSDIYRNHLAYIQKFEKFSQFIQLHKTESIANKIVKAVTDKKVKNRYVAPYIQWVGLKLLRLLKM